MTRPIIAIVGPGRMGRGMAHAFAYTGHPVRLLDTKRRTPEETAQALAAAHAEISRSLQTMAALGAITEAQAVGMAARVTCSSDIDAALAEADVIFEAVPEVVAAKRDCFARIGAAARPEVAISSTTSTFNVEELAALVVNPARFLNTHWLNPAFLVPLVEVSAGQGTDPAILQSMLALLRAAGKVPVECKPAPGFIIPRIQALAMNEAARIVAEGTATAEAVDTATRVAFGTRFAIMGLLEFIDYGGGDILYYASNYLEKSLDAPRFAPPDIVRDNMQQGRTGARAGAGFYDWSARDLTDYQRELFAKLFDLLQHMQLLPKPVG